jgi:hypothetical protein
MTAPCKLAFPFLKYPRISYIVAAIYDSAATSLSNSPLAPDPGWRRAVGTCLWRILTQAAIGV